MARLQISMHTKQLVSSKASAEENSLKRLLKHIFGALYFKFISLRNWEKSCRCLLTGRGRVQLILAPTAIFQRTECFSRVMLAPEHFKHI